jgi:hypothetical protein
VVEIRPRSHPPQAAVLPRGHLDRRTARAATLFQVFLQHGLDRVLQIQPVTVLYRAPPEADPRFSGWWGEMDFAPTCW